MVKRQSAVHAYCIAPIQGVMPATIHNWSYRPWKNVHVAYTPPGPANLCHIILYKVSQYIVPPAVRDHNCRRFCPSHPSTVCKVPSPSSSAQPASAPPPSSAPPASSQLPCAAPPASSRYPGSASAARRHAGGLRGSAGQRAWTAGHGTPVRVYMCGRVSVNVCVYMCANESICVCVCVRMRGGKGFLTVVCVCC